MEGADAESTEEVRGRRPRARGRSTRTPQPANSEETEEHTKEEVAEVNPGTRRRPKGRLPRKRGRPSQEAQQQIEEVSN